MKRCNFLQFGLVASLGTPLLAALRQDRLDEAAEVFARSTAQGQVDAVLVGTSDKFEMFTSTI